MEKRKFLARSHDRTWLIKFAGIGDIGMQKFAQANALADEGVVPEPLAFCHGFLVEPWIDAPPFDVRNVDRSIVLAQIARYLAARVRRLPATRPGATVDALFAMAIQNTGECLGETARDRIATRLGDPTRLAPLIHPIATDNRMHAWEWLITPEGRLLKTDTLDHCVGHDLVGCQDVTWDIAGAAVEFALTTDERAFLASEVALLADRPVETTLIEPMEYCYLAFQIGLWTDALARCDGEDAYRIRSVVGRFTAGLSALLA
jgi:hypothetical protein